MRVLFSAYRRDDFADAEGFMVQCGIVLEEYPDEVIAAVTHPRTGIQRRSKFVPTIAEIVEACDEERAAIDRRRKLAESGPVKPIAYSRLDTTTPGRRANLFVPKDSPQYERCHEIACKAGPADWKLDPAGRDGVWINQALLWSVPIGHWATPISGEK